MKVIARVECSTGKIFEAELEVVEPQTLFVQPTKYNQFPEIYSSDGAQYVVASIVGAAAGKAVDKLQEFAKATQLELALAKLEKGYMVDNTGRVFEAAATRKGTERIQKKFIYTNEGVCMEVLMGKHVTFTKNKTLFTTKGIDQVKFFSEYGAKAKGLRILSKAAKIFIVFDIQGFTSDIQSGNVSISSLPGTSHATAVISAIGIVGDMWLKELDAELEAERANMLEKAKHEGLDAVKTLVNSTWKSWNGAFRSHPTELKHGEISYITLEITQETASKILQGKFRTYEEMWRFNNKSEGIRNITILVKQIGSHSDEYNKHVILTFFITE